MFVKYHQHRPARLQQKTRQSTPHLHRRADSIMNILAHHAGISEISICQFLGDSPNTSKALRMSNILSHSLDKHTARPVRLIKDV